MAPARVTRRSVRAARARPGAADRAVSATISAVLLILITVSLAALVGTSAGGFADSLSGSPAYLAVDATYDPAGDGNGGVAYVNLTVTGGSAGDAGDVVIRDDEGNQVEWAVLAGDGRIEAGDRVRIDGNGTDCVLTAVHEGAVYRVVHRTGEDRETVLAEYTVETPPENPGTYPC